MRAATHMSALWAILAVLALVKVGFLVAIGPVFMPDSVDYIAFADTILAGGDWYRVLDLRNEVLPLTGFRMVGYPAFLALCKIIGGDAWAWLAVTAQMILSLVATGCLFGLARDLTGRKTLATLVALGHGSAQTFYLDQCLLTDSLNASLLILATASVCRGLLRRRPPTLAEAAVVGGLVLGAFLLREAGVVLMYTLWPLIMLRCLTANVGLGRTAAVLAVSALPLIGGAQAYKAWNQFRSGESFVSTGAQGAIYRPALDLYRLGLPVFREDPLLGTVINLDGPAYAIPGEAFSAINEHLAQVHGMTPPQIARYGYGMYLRHWLRYPVERAGIMLAKFNRAIAYILIMPVVAPERLSLWSGGGTPLPTSGELSQKLVGEGRLDLAAALALRTVARAISATAMAVFFIGAPIVFVRNLQSVRWRAHIMAPSAAMLGGLWVFAVGYFVTYAAVHLEERYLLPVAPFVFICGLALIPPSFGLLAKVTATVRHKGKR